LDDIAGDIADLNSNTPNDKNSPRKVMVEASSKNKLPSTLEMKKNSSSSDQAEDVLLKLN